jgi:serine/threonine-protein kinase
VPEAAHAQLPGFEPADLVGSTFDGRYELVAHLATGGMGAVFRARHVHLRKDVALKVLRPDLSASPDIVERFRREAEIASALDHENIVRVTDFGRSEEGYLFLVMDLLSGESLFDRLRREGSLSPDVLVPILWQVCNGLEAAHALGVVHRDLKPENVFLARTPGGREVTKLLDFGIAKLARAAADAPDGPGSTAAGIVVGTPEYLAPEQAMGTEVDGRADLYAVGLIAWRALAGRHPFRADEPRALLMMQATRPLPPLTEARPELAALPGLVSAISRACEKDASARPQSAAELRDALAASLGSAFLLPPNATPSPSLSLSPLPFVPGLTPTAAATPSLRPAPEVHLALKVAGLRLALGRARLRLAARLAPAADALRRRPAIAAVAAVAAVVALVLGVGAAWRSGREAAQAEALLRAGRAPEALALVEAALASRPSDPDLVLLRARALLRTPGRADQGVEALAARGAGPPLGADVLADLAATLGSDRKMADRAGRLLLASGERAVPPLVAAAGSGPAVKRLRALVLLRDLGAEDRLDRTAAYAALVGDADCEIRRAAARRLGELGDPAALPALQRAGGARVETRGFLGLSRKEAACGAAEAAEAARRIQAAR